MSAPTPSEILRRWQEDEAHYKRRLKNLDHNPKDPEYRIPPQGNLTVCDMQRKIWQIIHDDDLISMTEQGKAELEHYLERAFLMAKKMNAKLRQYKYDYDDTWYAEEGAKEALWLDELKHGNKE